jgi:hypothetical protein
MSQQNIERGAGSNVFVDHRTFAASVRVLLQKNFGLWLSLVERFVRDEEAAGSNPASPTMQRMAGLRDENAVRLRSAKRMIIPPEAHIAVTTGPAGSHPASPTTSKLRARAGEWESAAPWLHLAPGMY